MDRNVDFVTHLSQLVALYSRDPLDRAAEKSALRGARAAAKHGDIDISMVDGKLHAGHLVTEDPPAEVVALEALMHTHGITHLRAKHHAKQEEVKRIAGLLGAAAAGRTTPTELRAALTAHAWTELSVVCTASVEDAAEAAAVPAAAPDAAVEATADVAENATAGVPAGADSAETTAPAMVQAPALPETSAALRSDEAPVAADERPEVLAAEDALAEESSSGPLATELPAAVVALVDPRHRELFERLITSSEPRTLRRLLEPVQSAIEQTAREGDLAASAHILLAMFACQALAADDEMRRQFVVTVRRLTKPTLLRAYAMLYGVAPEHGEAVEQVLSRFDEDGAEAVADRVGSARTAALRARYVSLLGRLPGTNDALRSMLDDEREVVVVRALELMVELRVPELERVLGEHLGHASARVRRVAAQGLAAVTESAFAGDALVRAADDASPAVRLAAAVALQSRRDARLAGPIAARVDEEPELDVQLALVTALGRIAAPEGVQKLIALSTPNERLLRRRNISVLRLGAIEAMGEARTPAAMVALQKLLEDREKEVREAAARLYSRARRQTTAGAGIPVVSDG